MIAKVIRGWDSRTLVDYLMGPGRHNQHTNPTVIAAWQGDPGALQPGLVGAGPFDFDAAELSALVRHIGEPADVIGLPRKQPAEGEAFFTKHGPVWHAPISLPAGDGALSMDTWAAIARDVMDRTGIAPAGDPGGCRWIAVHHGLSGDPDAPADTRNDHIHLAAVLVRQDTGRRFHPRNDFPAVRAVMREWEDRLKLTATARNDVGAPRAATRGEVEKSARRAATGMPAAERADPAETVRGQLRHTVADAAAIASTGEEFLAALDDRGVLVKLHHNTRSGAIDGYAVGLPGDTTAAGEQIYYGAGKSLAKDLSWPRLSAEWAGHGGRLAPAPERVTLDLTAGAFTVARSAVERARTALSSADTAHGREIAVAAHRMLAAYSRVTDGAVPDTTRAPRTAAVWSSHRSAAISRLRRPHRQVTPSPVADALNDAARGLLMLRMVSERGAGATASLELAVALATLLAEVAAWHDRHGETAAARGADLSAHRLRAGAPVTAAQRAARTTGGAAAAVATRTDRPDDRGITERARPAAPRRRPPLPPPDTPRKGPHR